MYTSSETKTILNRDVQIKRTGLPAYFSTGFFSKKYASISTTLQYTEQNQQIEITIPAVAHEAANRRRVLAVKINGQEAQLNHHARSILNMENTFKVEDMTTLMNFSISDYDQLALDGTHRFCLPYWYLPFADSYALYRATPEQEKMSLEDLRALNWPCILKNDAGFILHQDKLLYFRNDEFEELNETYAGIKNLIETHTTVPDGSFIGCNKIQEYCPHFQTTHSYPSHETGNIRVFLTQCLDAINKQDGRKKEIIIPIAREGLPHHWEIGMLTIHENNQTTFTLVAPSWHKTNITSFNNSMSLYTEAIVPIFNSILSTKGYQLITDNQHILFHAQKQFSLRGCGIAVSILIQNILNGTLPNVGQPINQFERIHAQSFPYITPEEDAIRRVQLALHLNNAHPADTHQQPAPKVVPLKTPIKTSFSSEISSLKKRLEDYIKRCQDDKIDNLNPFDKNLSYLSRSRALNRRANYFLAKQCLTRLLRGDNLEEIFSQQTLHTARDKILKDYRIKQEQCYASRGMNSQELGGIIRDARKIAQPHSYWNFWQACFSMKKSMSRFTFTCN